MPRRLRRKRGRRAAGLASPSRRPGRLPYYPDMTHPTVDGTRGVQPRVCPECDALAPPEARYCRACRCNLADPFAGRLATAKRRLGAAFLDSAVRDGGMFGPVLWPAIGGGTTMVTVLSAAYWAYSVYLWTRGTTPAKRFLSMTVVTEDGRPAGFLRMAFRETIGKWISTAAFGLGLLAIPRHAEKRGWHDRMAETWVIVEDD